MKRANRILMPAAAAALLVAGVLAGCSGGETKAAEPNPTQVESVPAQKQSEPASITVAESGFGEANDSGYLQWAAIVENPNEGQMAGNAQVKATLKDASGTVLDTATEYVTYLFPHQKTAVAGMLKTNGATPAKLEVVTSVQKNGWADAGGTQGGDADKAFEITGLTEAKDNYGMTTFTGEVANNGKKDLDSVRITLVYRDANNALVGGRSTYAENVPVGQKSAFSLSEYDAPEYASFEAYAMPSLAALMSSK